MNIDDWTVEDLLVLLTFDIDVSKVQLSAGHFYLFVGDSGSDLTPLINEAAQRNLIGLVPHHGTFVLCATESGVELARQAEDEQFRMYTRWRDVP